MNNYCNFKCACKNLMWSENVVASKLEAIGKLNGKKTAWIKSDLSIKKSNLVTRLIWTVVAKHFAWMRKHLFGVDLKRSRSLLVQIGKQMPQNAKIRFLHTKAVAKFNQIAPAYAFNPVVEIINANPETPMKELGFDTKEKVLAFLEKSGDDLKALNLTGIEIDNDILEKFINHCPGLNSLYIEDSEIGDKALFLISSKLPALKTLNLKYCEQITDAGLEHLKALTSLHSLDLEQCHEITDAGINELEKELPHLKIIR